MEEEKKKEALRTIAEKTKQAMDLITECERIADEARVSFSFDISYGVGGTYRGDPEERHADFDDGWHPSSYSC